jgi:hypothetical protein
MGKKNGVCPKCGLVCIITSNPSDYGCRMHVKCSTCDYTLDYNITCDTCSQRKGIYCLLNLSK